MTKQIPIEESKKTLEMLCERFPNTFFDGDQKESVKPLKNGIRHEILALYPEHFDKYALRVALGFYCSRKHYLKSVQTHTQRVDLDGNLCGEITEENRETALKVLQAFEKRFKTANKTEPKKSKKKPKAKKPEQAIEIIEKIEPKTPVDKVPETEIVARPKLTLKRKISPEK
jgi:ProP effector